MTADVLTERTTAYALRPYQHAAVQAGMAYLHNPRLAGRHGLIVAPTGSGKSLVIAGIAAGLNGPCVVFQPSKEILEQNAAKLTAYGYRPAVFSASVGRREIGAITLATIGSVVRQAEAFRDLPYVLIDECHLVNAKGGMYRDFLEALPRTRILGLTATPYRLASNSLGSQLRFLTRTRPRVFRDVVHHTQVGELFRAGYLSPLTYDINPIVNPDLLQLNTTGADYTDASVQRHFQTIGFGSRLRDVVLQQLAAGRKNVLVFTRFTEESRQLAAQVPGAAVVTADTPPVERARILADFKAGRIRVVSNVGIVAIGFDYPELECVVLARPTVSLALYYQQVGRAIRPHPSKTTAHVIDLVGLVRQFGRIEDLTLTPGGARGDQWVVASGPRPLTNLYFAQRGGQAGAPGRIRKGW